VAHGFALECLNQSVQFWTLLAVYINNCCAYLIDGGHSKDSAWEITSCCVRQIFDDINEVRVTARDSQDQDSRAGTARQHLWAILSAHAVMAEYVNRNFEDHPSLSAILRKTLTWQAPMELIRSIQTRVKAVEDKNTKLQSDINMLNEQVKELQAFKKTAMAKLK